MEGLQGHVLVSEQEGSYVLLKGACTVDGPEMGLVELIIGVGVVEVVEVTFRVS